MGHGFFLKLTCDIGTPRKGRNPTYNSVADRVFEKGGGALISDWKNYFGLSFTFF